MPDGRQQGLGAWPAGPAWVAPAALQAPLPSRPARGRPHPAEALRASGSVRAAAPLDGMLTPAAGGSWCGPCPFVAGGGGVTVGAAVTMVVGALLSVGITRTLRVRWAAAHSWLT